MSQSNEQVLGRRPITNQSDTRLVHAQATVPSGTIVCVPVKTKSNLDFQGIQINFLGMS